MRGIKAIIIFILIPIPCFSQLAVKPIISVSSTNSSYVNLSTYIEHSFFGINVKPGIKLSLNMGELFVSGSYQLSGSYNPNNFFNEKLFKYRSHFIGGEVSYHIFKNKKRFSPYISIFLASEVSKNSKNTYLNESFGYRDYPFIYESIFSPGYPPKITYWSYFYISTPFIGSLTGGCVFRASKDININLGVGYGLRWMKTKYAEWQKNEDINKKLKTISSKNDYFHLLDVQLGLSYSFPLKKTSKSE